MFRKNNSRQNSRKPLRQQGQQGHHGAGSGPKKVVSPNYRVDLMAHTFTQSTGGSGNTGGPGYGRQQGNGGYGSQQPRRDGGQPQQRRDGQQPRHQQHGRPKPHFKPKPRPMPSAPEAQKGYTNLHCEVRDDLFAAFKEKLQADGKSEKEVISQLISFYNMGKVTV